tara:strand:+ start:66 stop:527 length:462 start_codon:yes stop_codon:yes gene_type:complete
MGLNNLMLAIYSKGLVTSDQVETIGKITNREKRIQQAKNIIDNRWKDWYNKNPCSNINTLLDGTVKAMKAKSGCAVSGDSCTVVKDHLKEKFNKEASRPTDNPLPNEGGRKHKTKKNKKKGKKKTIKRKKGKKKSKKRGKKKTVKRRSKKSRK